MQSANKMVLTILLLLVSPVIGLTTYNYGVGNTIKAGISMKDVKEMNVTEGEMLELKCDLETKGLSKDDIPRYEWYNNVIKRFDGKQKEVVSFEANRKITRITCKIFIEKFSKSIKEASINLNVHYPPTPKLEFQQGFSIVNGVGEVNAGKRCKLKCNVSKANPIPHLFLFYSNENLLQNGSSENYDITSSKPSDAGDYTCVAVNSVGENTSNSLTLKILNYPPECQNKKGEDCRTIYYEHINETRTVSCNVESHPKPTEYWWNTDDMKTHMETHMKTHTINYTLRSNPTLLQCWARNREGRQKIKCDIDLRLASVPDPVSHCNITEDLQYLRCRSGCDGGSLQHFSIEVLTQTENEFVLETNSSFPTFFLKSLVHHENYNITVWSINVVGRSTPFTLIQTKTKRTSAPSSLLEDHPKILTYGIMITLTVIVVVIIFIVYMLRRSRKVTQEGQQREKDILLSANPAETDADNSPGSQSCRFLPDKNRTRVLVRRRSRYDEIIPADQNLSQINP